jgi:hypothetical protein
MIVDWHSGADARLPMNRVPEILQPGLLGDMVSSERTTPYRTGIWIRHAAGTLWLRPLDHRGARNYR